MAGEMKASGPVATMGTRHLPVIAHEQPSISPAQSQAADSLAARLIAREPRLLEGQRFWPGVTSGMGDWPNLVLEDHSWIALFGPVADEAYGYRARLLAGEGDQVVIGVNRSAAFEDYCQNVLGLGRVEMLQPRPARTMQALAERCSHDPDLLKRVAEPARAAGGLNLVPYMGTGGIWQFAARIAAQVGAELRVAAPPPQLTRLVNDKLWFARQVSELLGQEAEPESHAAYCLASLAGKVAKLAARHASVAVKLPDSASSAGNIVLHAKDIARHSLRDLCGDLAQTLRATGWRGTFPVMVTHWESPILGSPSVQLWIPARGEGEAVIEGIFDQSVRGAKAVFCGASPSTLSPDWRQRLADQAACLGRFFQRLGYFGRCSLDSILVGESEERARLHWVECNGRWGGTSIPMTLANRLVGDWASVAFAVIEDSGLIGRPWPIAEFLHDMNAVLYGLNGSGRGAVVLSPSRIAMGNGYEFLVLGSDADDLRLRIADLAAAFERRRCS